MRKSLLPLFLIFALSLYFAASEFNQIVTIKSSAPELHTYGIVPALTLEGTDGKPFTENELRGRVSLVSFFFSSCEGPCPTLNAEIAKLQRENKTSPTLQFVSISIDPERDTPEVLKSYGAKLGADSSTWHFLRGDADTVSLLAKNGFMLGVGGSKPEDMYHSTKIALVDPELRIRGYFDSADQEALQKLRVAAQSLTPRR